MGCFIRSALLNKEPNYIKRDLHTQIKDLICRKLFHQEKRSQLLSAKPRSCTADARSQLRNQSVQGAKSLLCLQLTLERNPFHILEYSGLLFGQTGS